MLRHIDEDAIADRVYQALIGVMGEGTRTPDLGGTATTTEFRDAIVRRVSNGRPPR